MNALARSLALVRMAREKTLRASRRKPPRRPPGAAGLAADLPTDPKPMPLVGGATVAIPIDETSDI